MDEDRFRLTELSELTGVQTRTIRHYISIGLLPSPLSKGRDAHYGKEHLERLKAIGVLRRKMKLEEIRELFSLEGIPDLSKLEEDQGLAVKESAQSYLEIIEGLFSRGPREIRSTRHSRPSELQSEMQGAVEDSGHMALYRPKLDENPETQTAPIEKLISLLQQGGTGKTAPARQGQPWHVIEVLPGIEVHVRDQTEEQLARMEQVCDLIRNIMTGGHDA